LTRTLVLLLLVAGRLATAAAAPSSPSSPPSLLTRGQIAVGMGYGCARTTGDRLTCWGRSYPSRPTVVAGLDRVAGVVAAQATTCAWTTAGEVFCLGGGPPERVEGLADVVELATDPDAFVTCARRAGGTVACWSDFDKPGIVQDVPGISGALELAVAGTTACIRDAAGVGCWSTADAAPKLHRIAAARGATSLAGGRFKFVAVRGDRAPVGWHEQSYQPFALPPLPHDVVRVALGGDDACALGAGVQCWAVDDRRSLHALPGLDHPRELAVGYDLACALVEHGVACWGAVGLLGDGTPLSTDAPVTVAGLADATHLVTTTDEGTCARRAVGRAVCWGPRPGGKHAPRPIEVATRVAPAGPPRQWSGSHQRGAWTCTRRRHLDCMTTFYGHHGDISTDAETSFGDLDGARDLLLPNNETDQMCVADAAGAVSCFSAFDGAATASAVSGVTDVVQLVANGEVTCALERAGTVRCWNERERLYLGGKVTTVAGITDAVELVGGTLRVCARHRTGQVSCWGLRSLLGDDVDVHRAAPIVVPGVVPAAP
jgi:hypothetical protein